MKARHYLLFTALVVLGFIASLFLIVRGPELALIRYRDKEFDTALRQYEARLAAGDRSVSVVMPLCQLYLQFGNVDAAVSVMERFVRDNPSDVQARRELAKYYQYSQRGDRYLETLEELARSEPTEDTLRRLSDIYNFQGQYSDQVATLQRLVQIHQGTPQDLLDLASLQASQGRLADAAATLEQLQSAHPDVFDLQTMEFQISVLLDSNQADSAFRHAEAWLSTHRDAGGAARVASLVGFKGQPQKALSLLEPFQEAALSNADVLAELTQLEIVNGLRDRALDRLVRLDAGGRLPDSALEPYLDLLLTESKVAAALDVASRRDLGALPPWLLAGLADAALAAGRNDFAEFMLASLGESFLEGDPVLGARLALGRKDRAGAERWVLSAEGRDLSHRQKLGLAQVYATLGRSDDAIALLLAVSTDPLTPVQSIVDLANLYLDGEDAEAGFRAIESIRNGRDSPDIDAMWALLAAKAGKEGEAVRWLGRTPDDRIPEPLLENVYFLASDRNSRALAVMAAERLYARRGNRASRLQLVSALIAAGRPVDALRHVRALLPGDRGVESAYVEALQAALAAGAPVRDELRRFWSAQLPRTELDAAAREELIYALLGLGAYEAVLPTLADLARRQGDPWLFAYADAAVKSGRTTDLVRFLEAELERPGIDATARATRLQLLREHGGDEPALPYLRQFADAAGGDWVSAYEEALRTLDRQGDLVQYWRTRASRRDLPAEERRGMAFRALEAGQKALAESIFLDLAGNAPPESPDVLQLLFIWGPRPPQTPALEWLEARARASTGKAQALWMEHLINAGAPRRAVLAARGEFSEAYLRALLAAGDGAMLSRAIAAELPRTSDAGTLRRLASAALELGQTTAMRAVYDRLLAIVPDDREALRRAGALDFVEGRFLEAKSHLGRYLANGGSDYESHFSFGELLVRERDRGRARVHFERAVAEIDRIRQPTLHMRTVRALGLQRLGRVRESFAEFETLVREQPADAHLRADYAAALLESGRFDDARRVLASP